MLGWRSIVRAASISALVATSSAAKGAEGDAPAAATTALVLEVTPGTAGGPWKLRVQNTGDVPIRVLADSRLLGMELTRAAAPQDESKPRNAKAKALQPLRCALPADALPSSDDGPALVIPGKRSWTIAFDPLFHCFGARERAALVPGTVVRASYGFSTPVAKKAAAEGPPFVATPVGAAVSKLTPAKRIEATPFTLSEAVTVSPPPAAAAAANASNAEENGSETTRFSISLPETLDVARGADISTTVTVTNEGDRPVTILLRRKTVQFKVSGPAGSVACGTNTVIASPIRELFSTLGRRGRTQLSLLLTSVCPAGTFDEPGVYRVVPRLDTTGIAGRAIGMRMWAGATEGKRPLLLRVRNPRRPSAAGKRPALD